MPIQDASATSKINLTKSLFTGLEDLDMMSRFLNNLDLSKLESEKKRNKSLALTAFPSKLYSMLSDAEKLGNGSIVSWNPDGKSFIVYEPEKLVKKVMPDYFKQTKYKSFQRQLNIYGFQRISSGPFEGSYYHQRFIRGREDLCKNMLRQPSKEKQEELSNMKIDHTDRPSLVRNSSVHSWPFYASTIANKGADKESLKVSQTEANIDISTMPDSPSKRRYSEGFETVKKSYTDSFPDIDQKIMFSHSNKEKVDNATHTGDIESSDEDGIQEGTKLSFGGKHFYFLDPDKQLPDSS